MVRVVCIMEEEKKEWWQKNEGLSCREEFRKFERRRMMKTDE